MPRIPGDGRANHASCTIEDSLFLFGGLTGHYRSCLHIDKMVQADGSSPTWHVLSIKTSLDYSGRIVDVCPLNCSEVLIFYSCFSVAGILNLKTGDEEKMKDEFGRPLLLSVNAFFSFKKNTVLLNVDDEGCFKLFTRGQNRLEPFFLK